MIKIENTDIDLKGTIECGQIFRYEKESDNSYTIILRDRGVNVKKEEDVLYVSSNNENNLESVIKNYLDLDRDYDSLNKKLIKDNNELLSIIDFCKGFKIINQSKFECIISYILSSNNGVNQIRNSLNLISEKYGKKVIFNNKDYYLFPSFIDLKNATKEDYRILKTGFRDKYIFDMVKKINDKDFIIDDIDNMNSNDALNYLMSNKGIGEKVSSCILLFSYSRFDVFPIDTWVKKYMKDTYNILTVNEIKKFSMEKYGKYSGLVIQYMFHYKRNKEN